MTETQENKQEEPVVTPAATMSVEEQAARYLMGALPAFRHKLMRLEERNKHEVSRVLSALIEAPLEQETPLFTTKEANELYNLGLVITNAKLFLFNGALKVESVVEEATKNAVEESNKENQNVG